MEQLANKKKGSETMPDAGVILNEGMNASDSSLYGPLPQGHRKSPLLGA